MMLEKRAIFSLRELLQQQQNFWIRYRRISSQINSLVCNELMIKPDLDISIFENKIKILNNFIVHNYGASIQELSVDVSSSFSKNNMGKNRNSDLSHNLSKLKSQQSIIQAISSDQSVQRIQQWIATIIFNVQLRNDRYIDELTEMLSESSGTSIELDNRQIVDSMKNESKKWMTFLLNLPVLEQIIQQKAQALKVSTPKNAPLPSVSLLFIETLKYIRDKNQISLTYHQNLKYLEPMIKSMNPFTLSLPQIRNCNQKLFLPENFDRLTELLQSNYNFQLIGLVKIIYAKFNSFQQTRQILSHSSQATESSVQKSGMALMERMMAYLVKKYSKNQIFSEKALEVDRIYTLFQMSMEYIYIGVYLQWQHMIQKMIEKAFSENAQSIYDVISLANNPISSFLSKLPFSYPQYNQFIAKTYLTLIDKYHNKTLALQITKKLMFNRFLLNISLFTAFEGIDEVDFFHRKEKIVGWFNEIRMLFYYNKLGNKIVEVNGCQITNMIPEKQKYYMDLLKTAQLNEKIIEKNMLLTNSHSFYNEPLYLFDKQLYPQYETIYNDMQFANQIKSDNHFNDTSSFGFGEQGLKKQETNKLANESNSSAEQSVSFSFIQNSMSGEASMEDNRGVKNTLKINNHENDSKRPNIALHSPQYRYSPEQIAKNKSQKTVHTEETDHEQEKDSIELVWQLVKIRRAFGNNRREIDKRIKERKAKRQQVFNFCNIVHEQFNETKRQLQRTIHKIHIDIETL